MSYKIGEWTRARNDFENAFGISIQPFYDGLITLVFKSVKIDPFKFDDFLHKVHGNYEDDGKSMNDIVIEKYGENALKTLNRLI